MRSVSFSDGGLRDRDIIFRDEMDLVLSFPVRLFYFSLPIVLAFFHEQTHTLTQTSKVPRDAESPKEDREQFASHDFWISD